jgi:hypothetical protein
MSSTSDISDEEQSSFYIKNIYKEELFESYNDNFINSSNVDNNFETFDDEQKDKSINIFFPDKKNKVEYSCCDDNIYQKKIDHLNEIKPQKEKEKNNLKKKKHDKTESGNIRSKIKNHFHKFIIEFLNEQIKENNDGKQIVKFRKINYKTINIRNRKENKELIEGKIKEIFKYDISSKFKYKSNDQNLKTLNAIYHNPKLKKYLDMTYEEFYTKLFLKDEHPSTVSTKVDFFCDFIKKEKKKELKKINLNEENIYINQTIIIDNYLNIIKKVAKYYIRYYKCGKNNFKNKKFKINKKMK